MKLNQHQTKPVFFRADQGGCAFYRTILPARTTNGLVTEQFLVQRNPENKQIAGFGQLGTPTIFQRPVHRDVLAAQQTLKNHGIKNIVEVDDDLFNMSYQNPVNIYWPKEKLACLAESLKHADVVTCTTPELQNVLKIRNKNTRIIPNAIDLNDIDLTIQRNNEQLTIGWAGSWTHHYDIQQALPAFRWATEYNVRVMFFGYDPLEPDNKTPGNYTRNGITYTFVRWEKDMRQHYRNISQLDIAFAPLINNTFNASKSNLKWIEHSVFQTPMIVSHAPAYKNVQHGKTGFVAKNPADYLKYLKVLVNNPELRNELGAQAQTEVIQNYTLESTGPLWNDVVYGNA